MIDELKKYSNESSIVFMPVTEKDYYDGINDTLKSVLLFKKNEEDNQIISLINNSKINKIYLFGYDDFYRFIIPKIKKKIKICWIFHNDFSSLSNETIRYNLNTIIAFWSDKNNIFFFFIIEKKFFSFNMNSIPTCL